MGDVILLKSQFMQIGVLPLLQKLHRVKIDFKQIWKSGEPNRDKVDLFLRWYRTIADIKMKDLNANTIEQAVEMIRGTRFYGMTKVDFWYENLKTC